MAENQISVTVVIRSFHRIPSLIELLTKVLNQTYPDFEVLVIEQSGDEINKYDKELAILKKDPRLRIITTKPLGPAGARNEALRHANGEVLLFIDDDDLPVEKDWITLHALNYRDKNIIGVSGREIHFIGEECGYSNRKKAEKYCLHYDFLGYPYVYCRLDKRIDPVQWLHGSNASVRTNFVKKTDGWDETFFDHEEHSFAFKLNKILKKNERLIFDPKPVMLRRKNIAGGLNRRKVTFFAAFKHHFIYFHKLIGYYRPLRFICLYPVYLILIFALAIKSITESSPANRH